MTRWTILPRLAAAAIAAALAVVGPVQAAQAAAPAWQPTDDDALLLQLRTGKYRFGETLRGYQTPDGICVDLADMIQTLDLPVRLDKKSRRATGWIFAESETLTIDRDSNTVQTVNGRAPIGEAAIHDTPEGWCVDTRALSGWLGVTFRADLSNLNLVLETERTLPFLQAIERRSRAARLRPAATFDLAQLPQAEVPYRSWRTPSVDVLVASSWRRTAGQGTSGSIQYEAYATGEALGVSYDARLASDQDAIPESLRVRAYRIDPAGGLLGPLGATQAMAGDVETFAGALTGQSAVGRGIFVSNRPLSRPPRFSVTTLRGELPTGWDAELYRNGQLMAFQSDRGDGRYEFPDIALMFGENLFEVVLYGPQGQIRRDRTDMPVGTDSIPVGKTWYWAGVLEQDRNLIDFRRHIADPQTGWRWGVGVERGIDRRTTLGIGAQSLTLKGRRETYLEATLMRAVGPMLVELSGAQQLGAGRAVQGRAVGRLGRINFQAEVMWIDGGFESEVISANSSRSYGLRLDSELKFGESRVPVQAGVRRTLSREGIMVTEWLTRASMVMQGVSLTAELSGKTSAGRSAVTNQDGMRLRMLANTLIGKVRVRGDARFRLTGQQGGFESAELSAETQLTRRSDLRGSVQYQGGSGRLDFGLGYIRQFDRFALRSEAKVGSNGDVGLSLSLAFSLGPDPVDGGWRVSSGKLAQNGHAAVTVFRDENGDGVRQPGEEPVEGVEIATGFSMEQRETDASGRTVVDGLRAFTPTLVGIDASSVSDPLLQPKGRGVVVVPRPGIAAAIELPLAPTGEIEGMLLGIDGEVREGVTLELVDGAGQVVKQVGSEFDGYFLFDLVPYGEYRLRVGSGSAGALGARQELDVQVRLGREAPTVKVGSVRLQPATRAPQVAAATP